MTLHASKMFAVEVSIRLLYCSFTAKVKAVIQVWLKNFQNTTEISYSPCNLIILRIHDDHWLDKILVLMFLQRNKHHYPAANFTIALLMTSLTAQTPWTVYWRSRKIIKHCLPITNKTWFAMKLKTVPETKQVMEEIFK